MRGVDLHAVKAGLLGQLGAVGEAFDQFGDVLLFHGPGYAEQLRVLAQIQRHRRGRPQLAAQVGVGLPARMVELHPHLRAAGFGCLGPVAERLQRHARFQHHAAGTGHGAAIDHDIAGDQQAGAALTPAAVQVGQGGAGQLAGFGKVFLHGRLAQTVGQYRAAGQ